MEAAIACVGEKGNLRDVLRAKDVDNDLKEALVELQIFTSDVVGTDGARAQLRHEQNGYCAVFGPAADFHTVIWQTCAVLWWYNYIPTVEKRRTELICFPMSLRCPQRAKCSRSLR